MLVVQKTTEGSNPSLSANFRFPYFSSIHFLVFRRVFCGSRCFLRKVAVCLSWPLGAYEWNRRCRSAAFGGLCWGLEHLQTRIIKQRSLLADLRLFHVLAVPVTSTNIFLWSWRSSPRSFCLCFRVWRLVEGQP